MTELTTDIAHSLIIPCGEVQVDGILFVPKEALGIILFAHGSGSSHLSTRNKFVGEILNEAKLATLLFDLLTPAEEELDERTLEFRFDIDFLAERLIGASNWISTLPLTRDLPLGYFGASTGGGAALVAAAEQPNKVKAVVSRGGRPDLADEALTRVKAPVLLIVGGNDKQVIEMNQEAMQKLTCIKQLEIVSGATHLFEEPGTLHEVAELAKNWFVKHLS